MKDGIDLTDPEDVAAARAWSTRRAAALAALERAKARRAVLAATLAAEPAASLRAALRAAQEASSRASAALQDGQATLAQAERAAALFEANELATAQQAADEATRTVGAALAELLAEATTSAALTATVDGLALRARYRAALEHDPPLWDAATIPLREHTTDSPPDPQLLLPSAEDADQPVLLAVLDRLDDRVDAVADLVTAEGVHHLVNGNLVRSGAALEVAASGAVPDELDVIRTPRGGRDLTQRVLILLPAAPQPAWTAAEPGVAALVDPALAAWASTLLPDPAQVELVARTEAASTVLKADALGLDPLAWLRVAAAPAELAARVARVTRETLGGGTITVADSEPHDPAALVLGDLLAAADAVRVLLGASRALEPADLGAEAPAASPAGALARAEDAVAGILAALAAAANASALVDALLAAAAVGVGEAIPPLDVEQPSLTALREQAAAAHARLSDRTAGASTAPRDRLAALCGSQLPLLGVVSADLGEEPTGVDPAAVRAWLADHARVRPACAALLAAYDLSEALDGAVLDVRAAGTDPQPGELASCVVRGYAGATPDPLTGLVVDTWTTTVPDATHPSAVAFHYDEPDATPPQAILVAVAPDVSADRDWDLDTLLDVVRSTAALAADRAVAAEHHPDAAVTLRDGP